MGNGTAQGDAMGTGRAVRVVMVRDQLGSLARQLERALFVSIARESTELRS